MMLPQAWFIDQQSVFGTLVSVFLDGTFTLLICKGKSPEVSQLLEDGLILWLSIE